MMVVIDLFSGAGGLTEGFFRQDFKIIAHVEKDKWACETLKTRIIYHYLKKRNNLELYRSYLLNSKGYRKIKESREIIFNKYPELRTKLEFEVINKTFGNPLEEKNVCESEEIIKYIERSMKYNNVNSVDLIIGGPPCQAYSIVGRSRMKEAVIKDKRNYLFRYYKDIVARFQPKMFIFENVPGILTAMDGKIFKIIHDEFKQIGYEILSGPNEDIKKNILNSKDFGVAQNRKRLILFGFKEELNLNYPNFVANKIYKDLINVTTRQAISDLPQLSAGEGEDFGITSYLRRKPSKYQKIMREDSFGVLNHKARMHNDRDLGIYKKAILKAMKGKRLKYNELKENEKTHKNQDVFLDRFRVHWWDDIPHTIVAHISKDGHYNIHPDIKQLRSLTVREAARIQSFPDNYYFEGPRTAQYVQVGNAVPPLMSEAIAKTLKELKIR